MSRGTGCEANATTTAQASADRAARQQASWAAEMAVFNPASVADLAAAVDNCSGYSGHLAERADLEGDFWLHSGHDKEAIEEGFYEEAHDQIATMFPDDYPFPDVAFFTDYHSDLTELVSQGLRNICSYAGDVIRAVVARDGESVTTIEAALNDDRCGIINETPVHVFRTDRDGTRSELTLIVRERGFDYHGVAHLLDQGAEALAEYDAEQLASTNEQAS
jgi:hypothetical protein